MVCLTSQTRIDHRVLERILTTYLIGCTVFVGIRRTNPRSACPVEFVLRFTAEKNRSIAATATAVNVYCELTRKPQFNGERLIFASVLGVSNRSAIFFEGPKTALMRFHWRSSRIPVRISPKRSAGSYLRGVARGPG